MVTGIYGEDHLGGKVLIPKGSSNDRPWFESLIQLLCWTDSLVSKFVMGSLLVPDMMWGGGSSPL